MNTLAELMTELNHEGPLYDVSGREVEDENGIPDDPNDYRLLGVVENDGETSAFVIGPSGQRDRVTFLDGVRLERDIVWEFKCEPIETDGVNQVRVEDLAGRWALFGENGERITSGDLENDEVKEMRAAADELFDVAVA